MSVSARVLLVVSSLATAACGSASTTSDAPADGPGGKADDTSELECPAPVIDFVEECVLEVNEAIGPVDRASALDGCFGTPFFGFGDEPEEVFIDLCFDEPDFCEQGMEHFVLEIVPACEAEMMATADDLSANSCSLAASEPRELVRFSLNDHIQYRCRGESGFVQTACCEDEMQTWSEESTCPLQVKWNDASGSARRCVEDSADTEGGQFVPTACCEALCPHDVEIREQANGDYCVGPDGEFVNSVCCDIAADQVCEAAAFDETLSRGGARLCRDTNTGRFAPSLCCVDDCFEEITAGNEIPVACTETVEAECEGATENAGGLCHDPESGKFVKAACCELEDDAAKDLSDLLWECEELNDDVIRCQTGDDWACDRQEGAMDTTFDEECCEANPDGGWEYCW